MNSMAINYNKALSNLSNAFIYLSLAVLITGLYPFIKTGDILGLSASFIIPFYIAFAKTKSAEKGIISGFFTLLSCVIYYSFSGEYFSLVYLLITGFALLSAVKGMRLSYALLCVILYSVFVCVLFGVLHPLLLEYLKAFC